MKDETPRSTLARFMDVQSALSQGGIEKSQYNDQQKYYFRGIDDVQIALAPLLAKHRLLVIPEIVSHNMEVRSTKNGSAIYHHIVEVDYRVHSEDGTLGPFRAIGECLDTGDKGVSKACTAAYKCWLLAALCVPIAGQDDSDTEQAVETFEDLPKLTPEEIVELRNMMSAAKADEAGFLKYFEVETLEELPARQAAKATAMLKKKMAQANTDNGEA